MSTTKFGTKGKGKILYTGFTTAEVRLISPSVEEIKDFYDMDEMPKDVIYAENKEFKVKGEDGVEEVEFLPTATIAIYLQDLANRKFKHSITLKRKIATSKTGKTQFVNQTGQTTWVESEDDLKDNFTTFLSKEKEVLGYKTYRPAYVGEADLVDFLNKFLDLAYFDKESSEYKNLLAYDIENFFAGDFSELQELIDMDIARKFGVLAIVTEKDGEEGTKTYQNVWKHFLNVKDMKLINNAKYTSEKVMVLVERNAKKDKEKADWLKDHEKWVVEACDPEYGIDGSFKLAPISEWNIDEDFIVSRAAFVDTEGQDANENEEDTSRY